MSIYLITYLHAIRAVKITHVRKFHWPGYVERVSTVVVIQAIDVTKAEVAHCPDKHCLLHDAGTQQVHHCQADKGLDGEMNDLTADTKTHAPHVHFVQWVSSFLTAHQHIKGYFVPSRLLWKQKRIVYEKSITKKYKKSAATMVSGACTDC